MIRVRVTGSTLDAGDVAAAVAALRDHGVVAYPTETFYGLGADPRSTAAVRKVFAVKGRPPDQPIPLIAADAEQIADHVGTMTPLAQRLASRLWPGALTLIIPASPRLCEDVHLSTGKVAVRVPSHAVARALAAAAGHAITSTSANFSGKPPASMPDDIVAMFGDTIDVLIDAGATPAGLPSTIVDVTGQSPALVRAGVVPWDRVLKFSQ